MLALPHLEALHEKYKSKGLIVAGIDPYDKPDDMKEFLGKRGVTYTILFSDKELPKQYQVSGYPTLYVINKKGKIVYSQIGFGENADKLKKIIRKTL